MISRIVIVEESSGACLFDRIWRWKGLPNTEQVSSLMQVFFQFSREHDTGDISQVWFSPPSASFAAETPPGGRRPSSSLLLQRKVSTLPTSLFRSDSGGVRRGHKAQALKMVSARVGNVIACTFFDGDTEAARARAYLQDTAQNFVKQFSVRIAAYARPKSSSGTASKIVCVEFDSFTQQADTIRLAHSKPQ